MEKIIDLMRELVCFPIKFYQIVISPVLQPRCRFYPSCSEYAVQVIKIHGVWRGLWFIIHRLARCQPWCQGGYDPVLPKHEPPYNEKD
ncbi:MAG: membrane protein insertion efficiency factor YidD [Legionella sp.]